MTTFDKASATLTDYFIGNYNKIDVKPGEYLMNFRCHDNAVHFATVKDDPKIAMVIYLNYRKKMPILHFVNMVHDEFVDNTLGTFTDNHDYYLLKIIDQSEFASIYDIFSNFRDSVHSLLPVHQRVILKNRTLV